MLDPSAFTDAIGDANDVSLLSDLPERPNERPQIARHPVPHRQLDQHGPDYLRAQLDKGMRDIVERSEGALFLQKRIRKAHRRDMAYE